MIRNLETHDWLMITSIFLMLLLVIMRSLYETRFLKLLSLTNMSAYFIEYKNRKNAFFSLFNALLLLFMLGVFSLFFLIVQSHFFKVDLTLRNYLNTIKIFSLFIIGRYLIGKILSFIFGINKIQGILSFVKFTYLSIITIYLFPISFLYIYSFNNAYFLWFALGVFVLFLVFFYIKILITNQKLIFSNLFYFILYLCALEIAPLIYLYKLMILKV